MCCLAVKVFKNTEGVGQSNCREFGLGFAKLVSVSKVENEHGKKTEENCASFRVANSEAAGTERERGEEIE